jgi:hypothetical protein
VNSLTVTNCLDSIPCGIECQGVICAALDTIYAQLLQPLATFCMGDQMRRHQRRLALISVVLHGFSIFYCTIRVTVVEWERLNIEMRGSPCG